jgi:hypothetical protein
MRRLLCNREIDLTNRIFVICVYCRIKRGKNRGCKRKIPTWVSLDTDSRCLYRESEIPSKVVDGGGRSRKEKSVSFGK